MTKVLIDGGRTADLTDADPSGTIGDLAGALAEGAEHPGGIFSLKVGGTLIHPDTRTGDVALTGEHVVELVEVTGQDWSTPEPLELGVPHDAAGVLRVEVPDGTVEDLIAWAGEDIERARAVIDTELLQEHPRSTLLEHLRGHFDLPDDDDPDA
jgi:hypothetical protein